MAYRKSHCHCLSRHCLLWWNSWCRKWYTSPQNIRPRVPYLLRRWIPGHHLRAFHLYTFSLRLRFQHCKTVSIVFGFYERARSAERVLLWFKGEISVCAAQPGPARPCDTFDKLKSLERVDRFTSGLLCSMSPFNKFRICPTTIPAGAN